MNFMFLAKIEHFFIRTVLSLTLGSEMKVIYHIKWLYFDYLDNMIGRSHWNVSKATLSNNMLWPKLELMIMCEAGQITGYRAMLYI